MIKSDSLKNSSHGENRLPLKSLAKDTFSKVLHIHVRPMALFPPPESLGPFPGSLLAALDLVGHLN